MRKIELRGAANRQVRNKYSLVHSLDYPSPHPAKAKGWMAMSLPLFYLSRLCNTSPEMQKPTVYKRHINGRLCYRLYLAQASILQAKLHSPRYQSSSMQLKLCPCNYPRVPQTASACNNVGNAA